VPVLTLGELRRKGPPTLWVIPRVDPAEPRWKQTPRLYRRQLRFLTKSREKCPHLERLRPQRPRPINALRSHLLGGNSAARKQRFACQPWPPSIDSRIRASARRMFGASHMVEASPALPRVERDAGLQSWRSGINEKCGKTGRSQADVARHAFTSQLTLAVRRSTAALSSNRRAPSHARLGLGG
jgi:hypothetical protein